MYWDNQLHWPIFKLHLHKNKSFFLRCEFVGMYLRDRLVYLELSVTVLLLEIYLLSSFAFSCNHLPMEDSRNLTSSGAWAYAMSAKNQVHSKGRGDFVSQVSRIGKGTGSASTDVWNSCFERNHFIWILSMMQYLQVIQVENDLWQALSKKYWFSQKLILLHN